MKKLINRNYKRESISVVIVHIEKSINNYSAYIDELPGCIATGETLDGVKKDITEATKLHLELMSETKTPIPTIFKRNYRLEFKQ